jgi:hypothetical protein
MPENSDPGMLGFWSGTLMPVETPQSYEERAEECVRLASLTKDDLIRISLLQLKQTYLRTANRLRAFAEGKLFCSQISV